MDTDQVTEESNPVGIGRVIFPTRRPRQRGDHDRTTVPGGNGRAHKLRIHVATLRAEFGTTLQQHRADRKSTRLNSSHRT